MTIISDGTLFQMVASGDLGIIPFVAENVQPASIDVRASGQFRVFRNDGTTHIDPRENQPDLTEKTSQEGDKPFVLHPGEFVLGSTVERFTLPHHVVGRLEGKSSLGRLGLVIHSTAGFIDPGFDGTITLELSNAATLPICLWSYMPIGQVSFQFLDRPCEIPYGAVSRNSKYQGQVDPTASQMHRNFDAHQTIKEIRDERQEAGTPIVLPPSNPSESLICTCAFIGTREEKVTDPHCPIHGLKE